MKKSHPAVIDPGPAFPLDILRERLLIRDRGEDSEAKLTPEAKIGLVDANKLNIRSQNSIHSDTVAPPLSRGTPGGYFTRKGRLVRSAG